MEKAKPSSQFDKKFGLFVKKKRMELDWSQAHLADKVGNNYQNISRLERGEISPTLFWCYKLADAFDVELSVLLSEFGYKMRKN
jgi:ribosome-binding protein aMBF1 (putative translation factor)